MSGSVTRGRGLPRGRWCKARRWRTSTTVQHAGAASAGLILAACSATAGGLDGEARSNVNGAIISQHRSETLEVYGRADYDWTLQSLDGDTVAFESFSGDVLFVNMWATWCAPCIAELASIERLRESIRDAPVRFLIVSPEPIDRVREFVRRHDYRLPFHVELRELPAAFDLRALPTTYVVTGSGDIVLRHRGAADWDDDNVRAFLLHLAARAHASRPPRRDALRMDRS